MKITNSELARIIQEEVATILEQGQSLASGPVDRSFPQDYSPEEEKAAETLAAPDVDWAAKGTKAKVAAGVATLKEKHAANAAALKKAVRDKGVKSWKELERDHPAREAYRKSYRAIRKAKAKRLARKGRQQAQEQGRGGADWRAGEKAGLAMNVASERSKMTAKSARKKGREAVEAGDMKKAKVYADIADKAEKTGEGAAARAKARPKERADAARVDQRISDQEKHLKAGKAVRAGSDTAAQALGFRSVSHAKRVERTLGRKLEKQYQQGS
jgi:hypothetical protein